ncbi:MAG: box helicase, partial [Dehalococcoidia bacterium]|nr:box helicase [Dehalococcoidia bacterium]
MLKTLDPTFEEFHLRPVTCRVLADIGISTPTPIQSQAIPVLLAGLDVVGQARTGSGKTLAYALPMVERCDSNTPGVQALVLVPTRELAVQVYGVMEAFAKALALRIMTLYGGRSLDPERQNLRRAQIVIGTPGRTLDHLRQGNLKLAKLRILVLDEGDEMLDRGFAPDVERILAQTPKERQTALFSATVPEWVTSMVRKHLRNPKMAKVDVGAESPPEIEHVVYEVSPANKLAALRTLLDGRGDGPVLVFGRTKHGVKKLARQLVELGYPVAALQGNLSQNARERVMADFRSGSVQILLATNVAARGLDVDGIERVINYELPESAGLFTHRVGRTGRMGRSGEAITFVTPEDADKWRQIERALGRKLPVKPWSGGNSVEGLNRSQAQSRPRPQNRPQLT